MKKILTALLLLFILFDVTLALVLFNPGNRISQLLEKLPKNCKVVDSSYCKSVKILGRESLNETIVAVFKLPKGSKVYAPVAGLLEFQRLEPGNLPIHYLKGDDGTIYYFLYEPESTPTKRNVKSGEVIGVETGKPMTEIKGYTLGISMVKNQRFDKEGFYKLFGK
ncbi:hypothetical protein KBC14_04035 [Candidatus Woesebacteria bacterium]|jgi:hypothetical protein|nr:hypothetical protein [Candidatus Woesebacteria bacterium]QQR63910.1 MAG: hypothetical protein IPH70_05455 [Candidatus Roizmanbacteria bacterium]